MEILNYIFEIGVILAVYNFLWWLIKLGISVLRGRGQKELFEIYLVKAIRYTFLADVLFLFSIQQNGDQVVLNSLLITGLIMLIYFVGKIQKKQERQSFFSIRGQANIPGMNDILKRIKPKFDLRFEALVVVLAIGLFVGFYFKPDLASNTISNWFLENILGIMNAPVFGFIFKIIGFFFLMSVIFKIISGFMAVIIGGRSSTHIGNDNDDNNDEIDDNDRFSHFR